eukprot:GGOE01002226.1.p1 GENE.GGOE01002226.1~~GGOE01002226.1.p1  ORF type:complete len:156 (-),score=8.50 GGOE01002226.1:223-690(-)
MHGDGGTDVRRPYKSDGRPPGGNAVLFRFSWEQAGKTEGIGGWRLDAARLASCLSGLPTSDRLNLQEPNLALRLHTTSKGMTLPPPSSLSAGHASAPPGSAGGGGHPQCFPLEPEIDIRLLHSEHRCPSSEQPALVVDAAKAAMDTEVDDFLDSL